MVKYMVYYTLAVFFFTFIFLFHLFYSLGIKILKTNINVISRRIIKYENKISFNYRSVLIEVHFVKKKKREEIKRIKRERRNYKK